MRLQELKKLRMSHTNVLIAKQKENKMWNVGSYTNKDYDLTLLHATRLAEKKYDKDCIIIMEYHNGLYRKYTSDGQLITEDYTNNHTVENLVTGCPVNLTACKFPLCTNDMACEKIVLDNPIRYDKTMEVVDMTSVKQYFNYQEELNNIESKRIKLEKAQDEIFEGIKTDITSVCIGYEIPDYEFEVELTRKGIKIIFNTKIYNHDRIIHFINTDLFTKLNELMGMNGLLNIQGQRKIAGNNVYVLELIYDL